jgi:hypothetical protein
MEKSCRRLKIHRIEELGMEDDCSERALLA